MMALDILKKLKFSRLYVSETLAKNCSTSAVWSMEYLDEVIAFIGPFAESEDVVATTDSLLSAGFREVHCMVLEDTDKCKCLVYPDNTVEFVEPTRVHFTNEARSKIEQLKSQGFREYTAKAFWKVDGDGTTYTVVGAMGDVRWHNDVDIQKLKTEYENRILGIRMDYENKLYDAAIKIDKIQALADFLAAVQEYNSDTDTLERALEKLNPENRLFGTADVLRSAYQKMVFSLFSTDEIGWIEWWMYEAQFGARQSSFSFSINGTEYETMGMGTDEFLMIMESSGCICRN